MRIRGKKFKKLNKLIRIVYAITTTVFVFSCIVNPIYAYSNKGKIRVELTPLINSNYKSNGSDYDSFYYYEADRLNRYIAYHNENPHLSAEDVVWMVNVNLDKDFYTNITTISDTSKLPLLVNKYNRLPNYYEPKLSKLSSGHYVTPETKVNFEAMKNDATRYGYKINVASAYRSYTYQKDLYQNYLKQDSEEEVNSYSAKAGHSEHQTGRALDLIGSNGSMQNFASTPESVWIEANAYKYGFIVRYPKNAKHITGYKYEPWHITYVGVNTATLMKSLGINTLEEYYVKYIGI